MSVPPVSSGTAERETGVLIASVEWWGDEGGENVERWRVGRRRGSD